MYISLVCALLCIVCCVSCRVHITIYFFYRNSQLKRIARQSTTHHISSITIFFLLPACLPVVRAAIVVYPSIHTYIHTCGPAKNVNSSNGNCKFIRDFFFLLLFHENERERSKKNILYQKPNAALNVVLVFIYLNVIFFLYFLYFFLFSYLSGSRRFQAR